VSASTAITGSERRRASVSEGRGNIPALLNVVVRK
jgi:hypothetical protein